MGIGLPTGCEKTIEAVKPFTWNLASFHTLSRLQGVESLQRINHKRVLSENFLQRQDLLQFSCVVMFCVVVLFVFMFFKGRETH